MEKAPGWIWIALIVISITLLIIGLSSKSSVKNNIYYPNYTFPDGTNQIRVPLLPVNQRLSREAGGWVITPVGSAYRIDFDKPIDGEYIDGRRFHREPNKPVDHGVRLTNAVFRLYGDGYVTITIKRNIY